MKVKRKRENINNPTCAEMGLIFQKCCCASPGPALLHDAFMGELLPFPAFVFAAGYGRKAAEKARGWAAAPGVWESGCAALYL